MVNFTRQRFILYVSHAYIDSRDIITLYHDDTLQRRHVYCPILLHETPYIGNNKIDIMITM